MADTLPSPSKPKSLYQQLSTADPEDLVKRQKALEERIHSTFQQSQQRVAQLIEENSTLATTVSSVHVNGARNTRHDFLKRVVSPLLSANQDRPYTQTELVQQASIVASKLSRFDIFATPIQVYIDKAEQTDPATTATDVTVNYTVKEKSKVLAKTGTDIGNAEGSAYANVQWRNVFGGAESLDLNATLGTRTRSSYAAALESPILANPDFKFQIGGIQSTVQKVFASHEELQRGGWGRFRWIGRSNSLHELGYNGYWRQITGLAEKASESIRQDAGDTFKSSISHTYTRDTRDTPLLPTTGTFTRTNNELAGFGPLAGDVAFLKSEFETQQATALPIPYFRSALESGVTFTTGIRAGLLYPLTLTGASSPSLSRINDRFQLGGPTDVRGFRLSGLGPHDGRDSVGGDVYAAFSTNLLLPLPKLGKDTPLRFQTFLTGGRLLALRSRDKEGQLDGSEVRDVMANTVKEFTNGSPSMAAGVGLVYAHPAARFELNFSLPLVVRRGEEGRKGFSVGVGINFL